MNWTKDCIYLMHRTTSPLPHFPIRSRSFVIEILSNIFHKSVSSKSGPLGY